MKAFQLKTLLLSMAVAGAASMAIAPVAAQAGVSANAGFVTDYIWRGMNQNADKGSPALQGGLDYEHDSGLFAGTWTSTLDQGYEYDLYAGWAGSFGGVDLGATYTSYMYTDEAKDNGFANFDEVNLSAGYGPLSIGYDIGKDNLIPKSEDRDYTHYSVSLDAGAVAEGMSLTYGATKYDKNKKASGYFDVGYATDVEGFDLGVDVIFSDANTNDTTYFVLGASKSFDLM